MPPQFANFAPIPGRVVESRTWKQLVQQGKQAEEIIARVKAEENKPRLEKSTRQALEASFQAKRKDTLATETKSPSKPQSARGVALQSSHAPISNTPLKMSM